jgi:hypothetical protein
LPLLKKYWEEKRRPFPRVFKIPLLKYRRQFYTSNSIPFLNYSNHFIYSLSYICNRNPFLLLILSHTLPPLDWPTDTHGKQYSRDEGGFSNCVNFRSMD